MQIFKYLVFYGQIHLLASFRASPHPSPIAPPIGPMEVQTQKGAPWYPPPNRSGQPKKRCPRFLCLPLSSRTTRDVGQAQILPTRWTLIRDPIMSYTKRPVSIKKWDQEGEEPLRYFLKEEMCDTQRPIQGSNSGCLGGATAHSPLI
jgi:hypothetical protein